MKHFPRTKVSKMTISTSSASADSSSAMQPHGNWLKPFSLLFSAVRSAIVAVWRKQLNSVNIPGTSPEALQKSKSVVRGAHASRVSVWASRPNHPNRSRRDAEGSRRDACAPRTNAIQAEARFGVLDPEGINYPRRKHHEDESPRRKTGANWNAGRCAAAHHCVFLYGARPGRPGATGGVWH